MAFVFSGILSDALSNVIQSVGKTMGLKFIETIRSRPDKLTEMNVYETSTKQFATSQLLEVERNFDEILEVVTRNENDLEQARSLDRIRSRISAIRYAIESASLLVLPQSIDKASDIIETLSYYYVLIVYYSVAIKKCLIEIRDGVEDESELNIKENLNTVRKQISTLEQIWALRPTSTINQDSVKVLRKQMNELSAGLVDTFSKKCESIYSHVDLAFKEVTIKKPKLFGKQQYNETLEELILKIVKTAPNQSISLQDIREAILNQVKDAKITIDEINQVGKNLYGKKLIYGMHEDKNTTFIDFRGSDKHPKCGNCNREGGLFVDYYTCPTGGYVCGNCVSFFGKCKICGEKIKPNHKLV